MEQRQRKNAVAPAHAEPQLCQINQHRVLVVDDDPCDRKLTARILERAGYEVVTAENGARGLRMLAEQDIQIVVSDWLMPTMNGLEFCETVRSIESVGFVYFIMVTGQGERERLSEAFDAGADDYLIKPYDSAEFLARVRAGGRIVELESRINQQRRDLCKANAEMSMLNGKLQELATTDAMTGLMNRRRAMEKLDELFGIAARYKLPLSCIMFDIDHFKGFNDTYGHAAGDAVLKVVAKTAADALRSTDVAARIGGEEFLIIAPNTKESDAESVAERLRKSIESLAVQYEEHTLRVNISLGVAGLSTGVQGAEHLVKLADDALYEAKNGGRNRTCVASSPTPKNTPEMQAI